MCVFFQFLNLFQMNWFRVRVGSLCTGGDCFDAASVDSPDHLGWIASDERPSGHVFGHHAAGTDHAAVTDGDART
jgi:hypothetical protein